jgi:RNA polymerase-binding transcription factor DksA
LFNDRVIDRLETAKTGWIQLLARMPESACCDNWELYQLDRARRCLSLIEQVIERVHSDSYGSSVEWGAPGKGERLDTHPETTIYALRVNMLPCQQCLRPLSGAIHA